VWIRIQQDNLICRCETAGSWGRVSFLQNSQTLLAKIKKPDSLLDSFMSKELGLQLLYCHRMDGRDLVTPKKFSNRVCIAR